MAGVLPIARDLNVQRQHQGRLLPIGDGVAATLVAQNHVPSMLAIDKDAQLTNAWTIPRGLGLLAGGNRLLWRSSHGSGQLRAIPRPRAQRAAKVTLTALPTTETPRQTAASPLPVADETKPSRGNYSAYRPIAIACE